jgi:hypothetical protein
VCECVSVLEELRKGSSREEVKGRNVCECNCLSVLVC